MKLIIKFLSEVRNELKKVTWPNRQEVINYLGLVIAISAIVAGFIGLIDFTLTKSFENLLVK